MNWIYKIFLFLFALSTLASSVFADPPRASHDHWRNTNYPSHYVMYDFATRTYVETIDCQVRYRFSLVSNELNTLTIFDQSRNMTVRLDYSGMHLKAAGATGFTFYQEGTFDTRTRFENQNPNGSVASVISKRHGCQWAEWFTGASAPTYYFVQKATNNNEVEIFDGSRNMWVKMNANSMFLKVGTAAYSFFHSGVWR